MKRYLIILSLFLFTSICNAQTIPNSGFEIWSTDGPYEIADFWTSSNDFTWQINNTIGLTNSMEFYEGMTSAKLITTNIGFSGAPYAGWMVNGLPELDVYTGEVDFFTAGTEFSTKPNILRGYYIFENDYVTTDSANVIVYFKKFNNLTNQSDTIGFGFEKLGPTVGFSQFEVNINDIAPGVMPDSMIIAFTTSEISQPETGGNLYIDNLNFDVLSTEVIAEDLIEIKTFPNPATDKLYIEYKGHDKELSINIYNFVGELVKLSRINQLGEVFEINVSDLPIGAYLLEIKSGKRHLQTQKLIVNRS